MTQWGLDALFNPAKRHMDEEKRRLQSTREQLGDASGGDRIDLASGKVIIRRKKDAAPVAANGAADRDDEHVEQTAQAENAATTPTGD